MNNAVHMLAGAALICLAFILPSSVVAQVEIGAKIGINYASADIELTYGESSKPSIRRGFLMGAVMDVGIGGPLSLQFEPQYVRKGYRLDDTSAGDNYTVILNLDYVEMPVLLKGSWHWDKFQAYAFAGPSLGFRMAAQVSSVFPNSYETRHVEYSTKEIDLSLDLGAGVGFQVGPHATLFTDARISRGLIDISTDAHSYHSNDFKVGVGILFAL